LVRKEGDRMTADAVVPVPLHPQPSRERGFNQVGLIGRPLSKSLDLPYLLVLLMRPRPEKHLLRREVGRQHVALLPCGKEVELTIYESCC